MICLTDMKREEPLDKTNGSFAIQMISLLENVSFHRA